MPEDDPSAEQDPETLDGAPPVAPTPEHDNEQAPKPAAVKSNREKAEGLTLLGFNAGARLAREILAKRCTLISCGLGTCGKDTHWQHDGTESLTVRELAKNTVAAIAVEGVEANIKSTGTGGDKLKLATELSRGRGITELLTHAKGERGIRVAVDRLDRHPELMAARNGTIDLRAGKLRESDPRDLLTRCAGTDYDPHASAPTFHKFLLEIQPESEVRAYIQRSDRLRSNRSGAQARFADMVGARGKRQKRSGGRRNARVRGLGDSGAGQPS